MELMNILIIEDNPDDAAMICEFLAMDACGNFRTEVMPTLAQAVEKAASKNYDAVLLDLTLPDSIGIETVRKIVRWCPDLPIIVLTAISDDKIAIESVRYGAQDYIEKRDISSRWLGRAIRYAIERKQILDQKEELLFDLSTALEEIEKLEMVVAVCFERFEKDLAICTNCKKIRNENGTWESLDAYLRSRANPDANRGICPECAASFSAVGQPGPCRR